MSWLKERKVLGRNMKNGLYGNSKSTERKVIDIAGFGPYVQLTNHGTFAIRTFSFQFSLCTGQTTAEITWILYLFGDWLLSSPSSEPGYWWCLKPQHCLHYAVEIWKHAALFLRLGLPSTVISYEISFRVDGKHFKKGAFLKRWRHYNHVISLLEFSYNTWWVILAFLLIPRVQPYIRRLSPQYMRQSKIRCPTETTRK